MARNRLQSALLIAAMTALVAACVWSLWGAGGIPWAIAGVVLALLFAPRIPIRLVLAMYRARVLDPARFPELHRIERELARRAGLPAVPALFWVPSAVPNAFAVGTANRAVIALSDGLLRGLDRRELVGVLAHETSHVANNDLAVMTFADLLSRISALLSHVGVLLGVMNLFLAVAGRQAVPWLAVFLLVLAPVAISLLQLALSRAREFDADRRAAELTLDPRGLASALRKMARFEAWAWHRLLLPGQRSPNPSLLRSHPPTAERIRRLLALPTGQAPHRLAPAGGAAELPAGYRRIERRPRWRWPGVWY